MPRFRRTNCWSLRLGDVIRYRAPDGRVTGRVVDLAFDSVARSAVGALTDEAGRTHTFRFSERDTVRRRLLGFGEILTARDEQRPTAGPITGYQVRVGRERDALWLHRHGQAYEARPEKPPRPPFANADEAQAACRWVELGCPGLATLVEPEYALRRGDQKPSGCGPAG